MNKYLVLTIDVEPDCTLQWRYSNPLTFDGVQMGIKDKLQPLFNEYGICPTYLINNVVLEDRKSVDTLKNLTGSFELGTHLHPEFIEPDKKFQVYDGKNAEANQCFLRSDIEFAKIQNITCLFEKCFGKKPLSFRAGRFSAGSNTIQSLKKLGYRVDTSVTPHLNWKDPTREMPIDFSKAKEQPYFIKDLSILEDTLAKEILEVPVSIIKIKKIFGNKLIWLRPIYSNYRDFIRVLKNYSKKYSNNDKLVYNMMFHNIELIPGKSPYTQTKRECENYLVVLENFFEYCKNEGIKSITLSDLYDEYVKKRQDS